MKVAATPVTLLTVILGVPVSPAEVPVVSWLSVGINPAAIEPDPLMVLPLGRVAP